MNDRELLELAAKAAGWTVKGWSEEYYSDGPYGDELASGLSVAGDNAPRTPWNPLEDDGDALRLAVHLHIDLKCYTETVRTWVGDPAAQRVLASIEELCGADPYDATRRAIVRAAAEIGKAMA